MFWVPFSIMGCVNTTTQCQKVGHTQHGSQRSNCGPLCGGNEGPKRCRLHSSCFNNTKFFPYVIGGGGHRSLSANKPTLNQHFFTTRNQGKRSRCFPHCPTETRVPCSCRRSLKSPTGMGKGQRKEMCAVAHKLPGFGENVITDLDK